MLKQVTLTGADDRTKISDLIELHSHYPFLELGILVGTHEGTPRFPSADWIRELVRARADTGLKLSLHVCGIPLREIVEQGTATNLLRTRELQGPHLFFKRIQLNVNGLVADPDSVFRNVGEVAANVLSVALQWDGKPEFIFQNAGKLPLEAMAGVKKLHKVSILNDASGGRGIVPEWPGPSGDCENGWAGGLSPDNLFDELPKIHAKASTSRNFWIDAETGVRDGDEFSIERGERFLSIANRWIQATQNGRNAS